MTDQPNRKFFLNLSQYLPGGQRCGRFPQQLAAKIGKSSAGAKTAARLKRQKPLQFSIDHVGTEEISECDDSLFDHSNAPPDGCSLQL